MNPKAQSIKERLAALETLDAAALRAEWAKVFGRPASPHLSRKFLLRAVAYRIQEQAGGGLKPATRRRLMRIAAQIRGGKGVEAVSAPSFRPGARLMREWNGETHVVEVIAGGFVWKDKRYRSLSAVARAITGVRWSGPRFFGLNGESKKPGQRGGDSGGEGML